MWKWTWQMQVAKYWKHGGQRSRSRGNFFRLRLHPKLSGSSGSGSSALVLAIAFATSIISTFVYQCLSEPAFPEYMKELVSPYIPSKCLRSSSFSLVQKPRLKFKNHGEKALPSQAAAFRNGLPNECKQAVSLKTLKKTTKNIPIQMSLLLILLWMWYYELL